MGRSAEILIVEDNPGDQMLAQEAFRRAQWAKEPYIVATGDDALRFLHHEGTFEQVPRPDLIVLDLNLPGMSGSEVLEELKADKKLSDIPVVVFSSSNERGDVLMSYGRGAVCYLRKPGDIDAYYRALDNLEGLWRSVAIRRSRLARWTRSQSRWGRLSVTPRTKREIMEWSAIAAAAAGAVALVKLLA